ncbi:serine hydrolase domain-containing protein [Alteromonas sp. KUL49]|uniref:serine hydrolase domain-containing protein n=1 Tax=Alteromonas sp. KUL49 TaxID=2480798 RepID=UPI0010FFBCD6|nr:serine hydrolase domain-containing protein [Alteromonas sp. KUL49]GEA11777.1 hypothetical protein KUL49_21520 [Alteromonas sp. KUL49]
MRFPYKRYAVCFSSIFTLAFLPLHALASERIFDPLHADASKLINVWVKSQLDYLQIPYLSISYVKDQDVLFSGSYGQVELNGAVDATSSTISSICSVTKVFTATAIVMLAEQGKLNLNDSVADILPALNVLNSEGESSDLNDIQVVHLLNHTSGLPRDTSHLYWSGPNHNFPTKKELYESLSNQKRETRADKASSYSNLGYALLGQIIEVVTGDSYSAFIEQEIFMPLRMSDSVVEMSETSYGKNHAVGYTALNRNGLRTKASFYKTRAMQSAFGISSNASDMAKFISWQFRLAQQSNTELMSPQSLLQMYETYHTQAATNRGLAYEVQTSESGDVWVMHGGMCPGYTSYLQMNTTGKEGYAVVMSANGVRPSSFIKDLKQILTKAAQLQVDKENGQLFKEYEGFYDLNPWNSEVYVGSWGRDLVLLYLPVDSVKYAMYHYRKVDNDTFQRLEDGVLTDEFMVFNRDQAGNVISVNNDGSLHYKL